MKTILFGEKIYRISNKDYNKLETFKVIPDGKDYFEHLEEEKELLLSIIKDKKHFCYIDEKYSYEMVNIE